MIVGIGHEKQVGKDTISGYLMDILWNEHGLSSRKRSFAQILYDICHTLYGWDGFRSKEYYDDNPKEKESVLPTINKSPRQILIDFGTAGVREKVYDGTWVEYLRHMNKPEDITLIPDVRFPNELAVLDLSVKLVRPSLSPSHDAADIALADYSGWDVKVVNDGDLIDLMGKAKELVNEILHTRASL